MTIPSYIQKFRFGQQVIGLLVPDAGAIEQAYREKRAKNPDSPFPYWSQVWPASLALCEWLAAHPEWIIRKKVMELGAGLGLPSLFAATLAREVHCSDYIAEAVELCRQSAAINGLSVQCEVLDWNVLSPGLTTDILLMSDVNYEPAVFEKLYAVLQQFILNGTTIILSSPQRLMAGPFIEQLLPYCVLQDEISVSKNDDVKMISLFILRKN